MIPSDGRKVDCRSKATAPPERPGDGSATGTGNQGLNRSILIVP